jgi:hypothetical protein
MHTVTDSITVLNMLPVNLPRLQKRFELPASEGADFSDPQRGLPFGAKPFRRAAFHQQSLNTFYLGR